MKQKDDKERIKTEKEAVIAAAASWNLKDLTEKLMNILMEIDSSIAWDKEEKLIDDRIMDSFMVISLISELEDQFQIEIDASEIIPENLNSVNAMWRMITKLQES